MPPIGESRTNCYLRNWTVFGPGYHKGQLYSLADCLRMGALFARLSTGAAPLVTPRVKVGHDVEQRLTESLGFPSLGRIYACRVGASGLTTIDLEMPAQLGALCNAGFYRDGSIEIAPPLPDPDDPSRKLYPVLVAVSLLGEEQPAVPLRYPMPRAVYADGTEVPAEKDLTPLARAMAEVARMSLRARPGKRPAWFVFAGRAYETETVRFSAMTPLPGTVAMTPEQKSALAAAGFTPEQIAAMEAALGAPPADPNKMAAVPPGGGAADPMGGLEQFADDPNTPPFAKAIMSAFSTFAADCTKRFGAMEGAVGDIQKLKPDAQMAAQFSREYQERVKAEHRSDVERVVDEAILGGKIEARDKAAHVSEGLAKSRTQTFSAGHAHAGKTEFAAWRDELLARQPSRYFSPDPVLAGADPGDPLEDRFVRETLSLLPKGREILAAKK